MTRQESRYIVHADRVEEVGDRTARRHRILVIDEHGDIGVLYATGAFESRAFSISAAELSYMARQARRAARRRLWARILRRR